MVSAFRLHALRAAHATLDANAAAVLAEEYGVDAAAWPADAASMTPDAFAEAAAEALAPLDVEEFNVAVARVSAPGRYDNAMRFDLTPEAIAGLADEIRARVKETGDAVAAVPEGEHTFENTVGALEGVSGALSALSSSLDFPMHVSPDEAVRNASAEADTALSAFYVEQNMREDVYRAVNALKARVDAGEVELAQEQRRALDFYVRDFRRSGLHLGGEERARVEAIKKELSKMSIEFSKNLSDDKTKVPFTVAELDGTPADVLASFAKEGGDDAGEDARRLVSLDYPDYVPVMKYCKVAETRRKLEYTYNRRCMDTNTRLMERMVELRHELANILSFPTFAAYQLETKMAKTPDTVMKFLSNLTERLEPLARKDLDALLALKRAECEELGTEFDGRINMWDYNYYVRLREEREFQVDQQRIQQFFPLDTVVKGTFGLYEGLFGVRFRRVDDAHVWHPDVQYYEVTNESDGSLVGGLYFDPHPREGKYGHAACWGSVPACTYRRRRDGAEVVQSPVTALVCNFTKPTPTKPSLLTHNEVVTFLHELGHGVHGLASRTTHLPRFAGTNVERDFVEAPSQMLEFFGWNAETLNLLAGHHEERDADGQPAKLPDDLVQKLIAAKNASSGLINKRQLVFGTFDMRIHTQPKADVAKVFADTVREVSGGLEATPGTCFPANFAHLAGGYEAGYYGYQWALSIATSMFYDAFGKEGVRNAATGMRYRNEILAPGGSRDGMESVVAFIGHEPTEDAFLRELGLDV